jgi:hypothetical protein
MLGDIPFGHTDTDFRDVDEIRKSAKEDFAHPHARH